MTDDRAERWVEGFRAAWATTDREEWYARFEAMLAPDGRLVQPVIPEAHGRAAVRQTFAGVFAFLPDLRAELTSWAASGDELFLAFTLTGTSPTGKTVTWRSVDRVELDADGLATLREAFFDPTPFLQAAQEAYATQSGS